MAKGAKRAGSPPIIARANFAFNLAARTTDSGVPPTPTRSGIAPLSVFGRTMSAGTLVPFMKELALPGDTFDIHLNCDIKTHPTIGPLFGSYKFECMVYEAPIRLYQAKLNNNKTKVGLDMSQIK